jgi:hypothetical protein
MFTGTIPKSQEEIVSYFPTNLEMDKYYPGFLGRRFQDIPKRMLQPLAIRKAILGDKFTPEKPEKSQEENDDRLRT